MLSDEMKRFYRQSVATFKENYGPEDVAPVEHSVGLVKTIAGHRPIDDDLIQDCMLKMVRAARCFDPSRGIRWSTYAVTACKRMMIDKYLDKDVKTVNVSTTKTGREEFDILGQAECGRHIQPYEYAEKNDMIREVLNKVDDLPYEMADIVRLKHGLNGNRPHTFKEIGKMYGVSKARIQQIESKAMAKLRDLLGA